MQNQNQNQPLVMETRLQNPDGSWFYRRKYKTTKQYQTESGELVKVFKYDIKKIPCSGPTPKKRGRKLKPISDELRAKITELYTAKVRNDQIEKLTGATRSQVESVIGDILFGPESF